MRITRVGGVSNDSVGLYACLLTDILNARQYTHYVVLHASGGRDIKKRDKEKGPIMPWSFHFVLDTYIHTWIIQYLCMAP